MGESFDEKVQRQKRISALQGILMNQRDALDALDLAHHFVYQSDDDWRQRADAIGEQIAREVVRTCEAIWELSGPEGRAR